MPDPSPPFSPPPATGLLAVWMNIAPEHEADFDGWYTRQHVPERVGVPGFRIGVRYEALQGDPHFLALYETDSPEVLASAPYRERLNDPTEWTQRVMPTFRDTVRVACRLLGTRGVGVGGVLRSYRIEPAPGRREALAEGLAGPLLDELLAQPGLARVRALEGVALPATASSSETEMRGPDRSASFLLLVEATAVEPLRAACAAVLSEARLADLGAQLPPQSGDYRAMYVLTS